MLSLFVAAVLAAPTTKPPCTRASAKPATIQAIMADQAQFWGKCVSITALTNGYLLFTSVEGYYRAGPLMGGDPAIDPDDRERLGLYNFDLLSRPPKFQLTQVTVVGTVHDCKKATDAAFASRGPNELVMVTGFCHYANGPYLWLTGVGQSTSINATRLLGEKMRAHVGDLAFAPKNWRYRRFVEQYARAYLDALRNGNKPAFLKLHFDAEHLSG